MNDKNTGNLFTFDANSVNSGIYDECAALTLDAWFDRWIHVCKTGIKETSELKYNQLYARYIRPELGDKTMPEIRPMDLQYFMSRLCNKDLTHEYISSIRCLLFSIFSDAVRFNIIYRNPMSCVTLPAGLKNCRMKGAFSDSELKEFIRRSEGSAYSNLFLVSAFTGMRIGEVLALKWTDIDFQNETIAVRHTLSYHSGKGFYLASPKSSSGLRLIPMTSGCVRIMQDVQRKQKNQKVQGSWNVTLAFQDFCFLTSRGAPIYASNVDLAVKKIVRSMQKDNLLRPENHYTFHSLRHTFATRCIEGGMSVKTLSTILGHSSSRITMDLYTHTSLETERRELAGITFPF